ncbi:MAG: 4-hydroxy-tetrahydrodipicolinate reductase [Dehalococcoidia bacterium]|nr:4-hydroxy-tetrahydrodipicolinate reductase [Dehalococcoidia bacterium]
MSTPIRVVVHGALGRMGREVVNATCKDPDLRLVGAVDAKAEGNTLPLPVGTGTVPLAKSLDSILTQVQPAVVVDFSNAEASLAMVRLATKHKVNLVIGTTGLSPENLDEIDRLAKVNGVGAVVAPNFALGAVMMIHLAKIAAKYFDNVEIIELHHDQKLDAPSGTAVSTARAIAEVRGKPFVHPKVQKETVGGARGAELQGVALHSVRLPGLMAHQEVIFGASGQTLIIRHDTINRECYMPGVLMAIKRVVDLKGLTIGLDRLLGLQ